MQKLLVSNKKLSSLNLTSTIEVIFSLQHELDLLSVCSNQAIHDELNYVARLAQTVERGTFNPEVEGSSPSSGGS